ncbi:MAG: DsbA family protein [Candidatus Peribacteraceae bacterium]|nr:DsbA family protein [Candidatus Peribacteraceae bacterium]MDD5075128.1 DsbA family protein [Candidatus Peribacteraceae bacterium]
MSNDPQKDLKLWFGISMILIGVIVGFTAAKISGTSIGSVPGIPTAQRSSQPTAPTAPPAAPTVSYENIDPITANDHVRGTANANITILEYSDMECPFCARVHPTMEQLLKDYGGKVNWVFRHFPLSFHPNAQKAAEATECAAELGGNDKFWEMTDMIYEKGSDNTQLAVYAKAIGLNEAAFTKCVDSGKYATKVSDMMQTGSKAGVQGTPGSLIINNKTKKVSMVSGAQPIANFKTAIDALLK